MRLRRAAGLAHHDHKSGLEPLTQGGEGAAHAVGIDVVEEVERQAGAGILQGADHQQRTQARAADADPEHIGEAGTAGGPDRTVQHIAAEGFDAIDFRLDVRTAGRIRRQLGITQPVVTHLTLFIRVGDGTGLQLGHGLEGLLEARAQAAEHRFIEPHPAHIQPETQTRVVPELAAEPLPLAVGVNAGSGSGGCHEAGSGKAQSEPIGESTVGKPFWGQKRRKKPRPTRDCVDKHTADRQPA